MLLARIFWQLRLQKDACNLISLFPSKLMTDRIGLEMNSRYNSAFILKVKQIRKILFPKNVKTLNGKERIGKPKARQARKSKNSIVKKK